MCYHRGIKLKKYSPIIIYYHLYNIEKIHLLNFRFLMWFFIYFDASLAEYNKLKNKFIKVTNKIAFQVV